MKSYHIPRDLIPLDSPFDQNDIDINTKLEPAADVVEDINIGTESNPKIINLSKKFPTKEKQGYMNLMKKYTDVFACSYEDLKKYDTSIIHHIIPIKPRDKPFRKKLRRINSKLVHIVQKYTHL